MKKHFTSIAGGILSVFLTLQAPAASFVAPEEGECTLRVDRIPLDVDTMSDVSDGLAVVAQTPVEGFPARHRRAAAQALALALALDPTNDSARNSVSAFINDKQVTAPTAESLIQAKALVWQLHSWLSTPEAGEDGRQLAALMGDSLRFLDPEHPSAVSLKDSPENGNWEGWVAGIDSFRQNQNETPPDKPEKSDFDPFEGIEENMPKKEEEKPDPNALQILLTEASVRTFLYEKVDGSKGYTLSPVIVTMKARKANEGEEGFTVEIKANEEQDKIRNKVAKPIFDALTSSLEFKPAAGRIELKTGEKTYLYKQNGDNLTGPGLALASSALSGNAPVGTILARLDENGKLAAPDDFWNILRSMTGEETGRLIVPASAEKYLTSLLTMEQKSFFLRYEVLMASTPADMIALSSSIPSPEHAAAFAEFDEIRKKSEGMATGAYVANSYVRQRLEKLSADAPYHLSAKLLAMQGAGKRPRALTREFLAAELLRVVEPVRFATNYKMQDAKKEARTRMNDIQKKCRDDIEELERLTDIRDRDLLEASSEMITSFRALTRELSKSGDYWEKASDIENAKNELNSRLTTLRAGLSKLSGVTLPETQNP
ncbi:MAG: hypothetical protein ACSHX9_04645 [Luteolibacter sp.]